MTVTLAYAEANLQDLLERASAGEEVVITNQECAQVRLVPEPVVEPAVEVKPLRQLGTMRHTLILPENWEAEWDRLGEEIADSMIDGPIFPPFRPLMERS